MRAILSLSIILTSVLFGCKPQQVLQLSDGEIHGDLHKAHIGQVTFMDGYLPYGEYNESKMLKEYEFDYTSNLNIRVFLAKPLTNYLHDLEPTLTVNELCKKGNYQFTFLVDGNKVYTENLNTGAGSPSMKNSSTIFTVPLASTEKEDSWGRFMWMRFMERNGGKEALSVGKHELKIEIRTYMDVKELKVGNIVAEGNLTLNVVDKKADTKGIVLNEINGNTGWEVSKEAFNKEKIIALKAEVEAKKFKDINSVVVIKNNKLLIEEYFNGAERSTIHNPRSVGKTFASTALGFAIQEGHIKNIDQAIATFYDLKKFKNPSPSKQEVRIRDLLTMSSAFDADDDDYDSPGNEEYMYPTADWVKFTLDVKMNEQIENGQRWSYFTAGVVVLGDIIHKSVPGGLEKYLHQKLMEPLEIKDYKWQYTPQKVANTAGGIQLRAIDFAKFGQLYKNGGKWNGQQLLNVEWVEASLAQQIARPEEKGGGFYGYLFWNNNFTINGKSYEVSYCTGNGGNKIYIFKDIPFVVVITASAYNQPYAHPQAKEMLEKYIMPAVLDEL